MSEENKATVRSMYAGINAGNINILLETTTEDFVEHEQFPGLPPTREGVVALFQAMRSAFPDLEMKAEDMIAEGDKVYARCVMSGTHQGEFMGAPASGNKVAVPFVDIFYFRAGKVAEHWGVMDSGVLMQQMGVMPSP